MNDNSISFIVALMPRLNQYNVQYIMDEYLERTDDKVFNSPSDIFECFIATCKRRAYEVLPVDKIETRIEGNNAILFTNDFSGEWFEFNCVIQINCTLGEYRSEKIYLYVPSEFISSIDEFTIDLERGETEA